MIPAIHQRGTDVAGLLRYLFGPGRNEEHRDPRIIATWAGGPSPAAIQPSARSAGGHDVRSLADFLEQPVRSARRQPTTTVWHTSLRTHPNDRTLSDNQWAHIAAEVMAAAGLAPHNDRQAVRWVAVRHGHDHIHLVATLVRQDGTTAWAWHDRVRVQAAARDIETRYNLYRVGPVDRTAHRRPTTAEHRKAERLHTRVVPRDILRREVRAAAIASANEHEFFLRLRTVGVLVRTRESTTRPGETTGYAVGLLDHCTGGGALIWYGGGRLAPDLTLPRLRQRWNIHRAASAPTRSTSRQRALAYRHAHRFIADLKNLDRLIAGQPDAASEIAYASSDVLSATARAAEGRAGGSMTEAAELFDRATRPAKSRKSAASTRARRLRALARSIARLGHLTNDEDTAAALELVAQFVSFADCLTEVFATTRQVHRAFAVQKAAAHLRAPATRAAVESGRTQPSLPGLQRMNRAHREFYPAK
jgi:hypothetical protein